ncbi:MAG: ATP-dependent helicase [Treponema sp.]|nr:ATP-dependent helicase [Treponema sp.]
MPNLEEFLAKNKSMIIAPAGYGKTHTIIECVKLCEAGKKCLILTHTHAGIASIKEKMKRETVESSKYSLETISSFTLQFLNAFHIDKDSIPNVESGSTYFNFAIDATIKALQAKPVKEVIKSSYSRLIVDEYQDCTQKQHQLILSLSNILSTHILGDPLQGIFGFKGSVLVDMESDEEMVGLNQNKQELDVPWRWNNTGAEGLGQSLVSIRSSLLNQEKIDLNHYRSNIEVIIVDENNYNLYMQTIRQKIYASQTQSLLLIHPKTENPAFRLNIVKQCPPIRLIEAIDEKIFYEYAKQFDEKYGEDLIASILSLMRGITSNTEIKKWFKDDNTLINKKSDTDKKVSNDLSKAIDQLLQNKTYYNIGILIEKILILPKNKCYRKELLFNIHESLRSSHLTGDTVYESMKKNRDVVRRQGRNVIGKCIGTTLLTKGLEFDTVIVLNAHQFKDPKHLYVALTRASRKLIIITANPVLSPYN